MDCISKRRSKKNWLLAFFFPLLAALFPFHTVCASPCDDGSIYIGFTGDILIHDGLYRHILPLRSFGSIWSRTAPLFQKADYIAVNLEGPAALGINRNRKDVGDVGFTYDLDVYSGTNFLFNYHPQILFDLKETGVNLVGNANNHSLDRGSIGIDKTLEMARKIDIPIVGIRKSNNPNSERYYLTEIQGYRFAFIACTEMTNGWVDSHGQVLLCYKDFAEIKTTIQRLSQRDDIAGVIVMPHWGVEYSHTPSINQINYGKKFLEAGAVAVVGSHPHVLQPTEKYITQDGRSTLVAYSLGNFVAFQAGIERKTGVVLYLRFNRSSEGKVQLIKSYYTPTYRDAYQVFPVGDHGPKDALDEAAKYFTNEERIAPHQQLCRSN